jgi:replicative DNA helicase
MDETSENSLQLDEISLLGNILLDTTGEKVLTTSQHLTPDDFSDFRNKEIYRACLAVQQKGRNVELSIVTEELKNAKTFDSIGGDDYLSLVIDKTNQIRPIENYITSIRDKSLLNRFLNRLSTVLSDAKTKPISDVSEFIGKSADDILEISQQRNVAEAKSLDVVADMVVEKLVKQSEDFKKNGVQPNGVTGVPTGYDVMDKLTKGWHKGDMIVIGARPSVGKTAYALNLLYQVARKNRAVVFFSLEMSAESIVMRLLNLATGLSSDEINSLEFKPGSTKNQLLVETNGDFEKISIVKKLQSGLSELSKLPFYIDDNPGSKMMDISTKCKKLQNQIREIKKMDISLIAIDYLGLITSPGKGGGDNRQQEVADISRQIKQMARQLAIPVIALTQLSRDSEKRNDHTPQISDIRDSGAIEQDADMILMLYRPDYYTKQQGMGGDGKKNENEEPQMDNTENEAISKVKVILIKNRNGSTGTVSYMFDKEHCMFNIASDEQGEDF